MSNYTNTNYGPPPMGQMNTLNGIPQPTTLSPQQNLLQQQQQQHHQQQQLTAPPPTQFVQQQEQILQQKQQFSQQTNQQQIPNASVPPMLNSNMSKFMPPTATANSNFAPPPSALNGPLPPRTQTATLPANNSLPPHLRPPVMNGPAAGMPLTNGGNVSANSSRTASPSLQALNQQHQQQQIKPPLLQQQPSHQSPTQQPPTQQHHQQLPQQQPQYQQHQLQQQIKPPPVSTIAPPPTAKPPIPVATENLSGLSGSMQNLNINRVNGAPAVSQQPGVGSTVQAPSAAQQVNFKNSPAQLPPPPIANSTAGNVQKLPTSSGFYNPSTVQAPTAVTSNAVYPSTQTQTAYGISTAPLMMRPPTTQQQQQLLTQPINASSNVQTHLSNMPPAQANAALQQNQLNNNNQQYSQPQQKPYPQPKQQQYPQSPPTTQRNAMYPTTGQLPPMPTPQQPTTQTTQQQYNHQAYSQAYHQQPAQPTTQPGMFNGQPNTGPLQYQNQQQYAGANTNQSMSVTQQGFSRLWGQDTIDLMQNRHILSPATTAPPKVVLHNQFHESINCNPNIMRCTIAKIPESNALLQKSRLPLGILIHPFRDINSLPVIQCPNIVRCRLCRTYINPFVYFVDSKMWKCNLCYRVNELPDDFQFDPATKTYGDVTRRPEVRSSTIEFIAPSEYMLRPPQPAIYLFLFDVSIIAQQSGYLENACAVLNKQLDDMPGDARAQVGFIAYNSQVHFYSMAENYNQPHEMTLIDIDDIFLPRPDNLLVNLKECKELVKDLLTQLPKRFADTHDSGSAMGAALQVAFKLMQATGGRITIFQTCLPNKGPGSLEPREDPNNRSAKDVVHLSPATDFYKRFALECSGFQIAVDLFLLNQQYSDMSTISGISKHSGGCVHHFPLYQKTKPHCVDSFRNCFKRYLTRKIGFEAVMRIRCTRGLQVHTFHGNFFVRSTDLLSLPNVNPDAGYGMQISYEETLTDVKTICFQAALLYTNSEGERRIRVHTLCLPVTSSLPEVMHAADTEAIISLLAKMAVDRSITSNLSDARDAFINATVDILNAFKIAQNLPAGQTGQLIVPRSLALMPLYILALLKHPAFRVGTSTRLDDRIYAMDCMKTLPLDQLIKYIYPEFYHLDVLFYNAQNSNDEDDEDELPNVPRLQLSAEFLDSRSMFLLDCGTLIIIYVGLNVPTNILVATLGIKATAELPDYFYGLPNVNSAESDALKRFILKLNDEKPYQPVIQIIRDTSTAKPQVIEKLVDDRSESSLSYYEFLQHIRTQVK